MDTVSALWIQYQRCGYSISDVDTCCAATLPRCHAAALPRCPGCKDPPAEGGGGESEQAGPLLNTPITHGSFGGKVFFTQGSFGGHGSFGGLQLHSRSCCPTIPGMPSTRELKNQKRLRRIQAKKGRALPVEDWENQATRDVTLKSKRTSLDPSLIPFTYPLRDLPDESEPLPLEQPPLEQPPLEQPSEDAPLPAILPEGLWPLGLRQKAQVLYLVQGLPAREMAPLLNRTPGQVQALISAEGWYTERRRMTAEVTEEVSRRARERTQEVIEAVGALSEQASISTLQRTNEAALFSPSLYAAQTVRTYAAASRGLVTVARQARGLSDEPLSAMNPSSQFNMSLFMLPSFKGVRRVEEVYPERDATLALESAIDPSLA